MAWLCVVTSGGVGNPPPVREFVFCAAPASILRFVALHALPLAWVTRSRRIRTDDCSAADARALNPLPPARTERTVAKADAAAAARRQRAACGPSRRRHSSAAARAARSLARARSRGRGSTSARRRCVVVSDSEIGHRTPYNFQYCCCPCFDLGTVQVHRVPVPGGTTVDYTVRQSNI
eukprot:SAG31_NODE_485_length_15021_cov_9.439791_13_plen_178_part_00